VVRGLAVYLKYKGQQNAMDSPSHFVDLGLCEFVSDLFKLLFFAMEPARKRIFSPVWEHFELISPNNVFTL
jgi:hypothetical protein